MRKNLLFIVILTFLYTSVSGSLNLSPNKVNDACNSGTGRIQLSVSGGAPPYTYLWSPNNLSTSDIFNLYAGTYTCTVTDNVGSTASITVVVNNDNFLDASGYFTRSTGFLNDGNYSLFFRNGLPNFLADDCLGNSVFGNYSQFLNLSPFVTNILNCSARTIKGLPYQIQLYDGSGCGLIVNDTLGAYGFATPTPSVYGACTNSSNGQINDTLNSYDDSLNFNWTHNYYEIFLYSAGNVLPIDSIKNGYNKNYFFHNLAAGNYTLEYYIRDNIGNFYPFKTVTVNIPDLGSVCGSISGDIYVDVNKNCILDFGEPMEDGALIQINPGSIYTNTDKNGHYSLDLNLGSYSLEHTPVYNGLLGVKCPVEPYNFSILIGNNTIINLADTSPGLDLMSFISMTTLRPAQSGRIKLTLINESAVPALTDSVVLNFDPLLIVAGTNPPANSSGPGYAIWYPPIQNALDWFNYDVYVTVPNNPALIGTYVYATATLYSSQIDVNPLNNYDSISRMITGSYDPNCKSVDPEGFGTGHWVPITTPYFDYQIEFQNTGNDTAFKVVIVDTLDSKFDFGTFIPLSSSHPYTWKIVSSGEITFTFESIYLVDSGHNLDGSKGFINYRISLDSAVLSGDEINNTAYIYFDANPAIATNTTLLTLFDCNDIIAVSPDSLFSCEFDNFEFIAPVNLPSDVNWKIDGANFSTNDTLQMISQLPIGTHTIELTASNPFCSQQQFYNWEVYANPTVSISCIGNLLTCTSNGNSYQWFINNNPIANATDTFYNATVSDNYSVLVTTIEGCTTMSAIIPVVVTGFEHIISDSKLLYWPNPVIDFLNIQLPLHVLDQPEIEIYDQTGRLIYRKKLLQHQSSEIFRLNVEMFEQGIYHIQLHDDANLYNLTWVKN